jgi:O-methyltransferase
VDQAVVRARHLARRLNAMVGRATGWRLARADVPPDIDAESREIITAVRPFTMTDAEKLYALISAVRYVHAGRVPGAIVECGVWRGGSVLAAALTLRSLGVDDRDIHLFDTFTGMPPPSDVDRYLTGGSAHDHLAAAGEESSVWAKASVAEVERNLSACGYPRDRLHFVAGRVEETLPNQAPGDIALLRLDTDWYESTRHELHHLYPRLVSGGVLILDDYGEWEGARLATDEFLAEQEAELLLVRVSGARVAVKP